MVKFDSRWSAPNRPVFRVLAFVLSLLFLGIGLSFLVSKILTKPFVFDSNVKFGAAATFYGTLLFFVAIRKSLPKWMDGEEEKGVDSPITKSSIRYQHLRKLLVFLLVVFLSIVLLVSFDTYSVFWWVALAYVLFVAYFIYMVFSVELMAFGYNPMLALTLFFPIWLNCSIIMYPSKYYKIEKG